MWTKSCDLPWTLEWLNKKKRNSLYLGALRIIYTINVIGFRTDLSSISQVWKKLDYMIVWGQGMPGIVGVVGSIDLLSKIFQASLVIVDISFLLLYYILLIVLQFLSFQVQYNLVWARISSGWILILSEGRFNRSVDQWEILYDKPIHKILCLAVSIIDPQRVVHIPVPCKCQ